MVKPLLEKRWSTSELAKVFKIPATNLFGWRQRYSFPGPIRPGAQGPGYEHDIIDVVLIAMALRLIAFGLKPDKACWAEWPIKAQVHGLLEDIPDEDAGTKPETPMSPLLAVDPGGEHWFFTKPDQLGEVMNGRDAMLVIDLKKIVRDTLDRFGQTIGKEVTK